MQNPHIIVGENNRCLCGSYQVGDERKPVACDDVIKAAQKLANEGSPEGTLLFAVLREHIVDQG